MLVLQLKPHEQIIIKDLVTQKEVTRIKLNPKQHLTTKLPHLCFEASGRYNIYRRSLHGSTD